MAANGRRHPHIAIPSGAAPPSNPSPVTDAWNFLVTPPPVDNHDPLNLWSDYRHSTFPVASPDSAYPPSPSFPVPDISPLGRPSSRPSSAYEPSMTHSPNGNADYSPESYLFRSPSQGSSLRPSLSQRSLGHRSTRSEVPLSSPSVYRGESRPPSFVASEESSPELNTAVLTDELSNLTLVEDGLHKFQTGKLSENDEAWHRLVPPEARDVLDKQEVQRQSVIFEVIRSERDYVRDLTLVRDVFVLPLLNTSFIPQPRVRSFVKTVFFNLDIILAHHRQLLDALFERQREQHPIIISITDIITDNTLNFTRPYEEYITHYPLAESHHRNELRRNPKYQYFLSECAQNPEVRKRDLITFLSRPVTRLPRLALLLEAIKKHTPPEHSDQEALPLILDALNTFIKSTQPGIEAAESKVKFWAMCESLVYQKGEILDLDLYDESRTLFHFGPLARRWKPDNSVTYRWTNLNVAVLDNYLLLLKPERRVGGEARNVVVSRPLPLEYLRLSSFKSPPETRKERSSSNSIDHAQSSRSILESLSIRSRYISMYPFTFYHASEPAKRSYTLYATSEQQREKWRVKLVEALALRRARQEANMWFAPHTISEGFFGAAPAGASMYSQTRTRKLTGKIKCATPLFSGGKSLVAVGCETGLYVTVRGQSHFRKILQFPNVQSLHAIPSHNKFLIHCDLGIKAYSLDLLARVAMQTSPPQPLDASREDITGPSEGVLFMKVAEFSGRVIVLYATKGFMKTSLHMLTVVSPDEAPPPRRGSTIGPLSFRPYSSPIDVPGDAYDITILRRTIGICSAKGIHIFEVEHLTSNATIVPNLLHTEDHPPMRLLAERLQRSKPLGLARHAEKELLVVFDETGCYINSHGVPTRQCGYLRWESKAVTFAHRGDHIILVSPEFIEIRTLDTGRLVQVIEGQDIRLVHSSHDAILVAMKGKSNANDSAGASGSEDKLVELIETSEIVPDQSLQTPELWDEWDM